VKPLFFAFLFLLLLGLLNIERLLPRARPRSHGHSRWASFFDAHRLGRPSLAGRLRTDGIVLGWFGGRLLQSPAEDNVLTFGVQRSGKTSTVAVPTLLGWRGAAVATSTKEELVRLTGGYRAQLGPVWVFAPLDDDPTWVRELGLRRAVWNPVAAAISTAIAMEIADLFTAEGKHGPSAHWYLSASSLITGLLLAERNRGGDLRGVLGRLNRLPLSEYVGLASELQSTDAGELLTAFAQTPEREAGSIASTARSALSLWLDSRVATATRAESPDRFDPDELLSAGGTLYLVAPAEDAERCRALFSALLQTILRLATLRARTQGGVLNPRLLLALDEVANFARIPRLASFISTGPGQGIQTLLCFHDLAQLEHGYGHDQARTVWNNCRARLLLPGQGDLRTLELFSKAIGDETRSYDLLSWAADGRVNRSQQQTGQPLAPLDELRRMREPVLLYATAPPAKLHARRWDQVTGWRRAIESSRVSQPGSALAGAAGQQPTGGNAHG
jgi:type IV secretion system protein VirD4